MRKFYHSQKTFRNSPVFTKGFILIVRNELSFICYITVQAIKCVLKKATGQNPHDLRPYRILISLLDKSDIGPLILDDILLEVFRYTLYFIPQAPNLGIVQNFVF